MKKSFLFFVCAMLFSMFNQLISINLSKIKIIPFGQSDVQSALDLIFLTADKAKIAPIPEDEQEQKAWHQSMMKEFQDIGSFEEIYLKNNGFFAAMFDCTVLIGIGGFKKIDEGVCELKRVFLHPDYHGHGLGKLLVSELMVQAKNYKNHKYHTMRLEVYNPPAQQPAINLYKKFGFYEIEKYDLGSKCKLFLEKKL